MKNISLLFTILSLAFTLKVNAQPSILVASNVSVGDSLIYNLGADKDVHKWESFHIEVLGTALAATDTTGKVEIYNTLNYDFTDAIDMDTNSLLLLADSLGGTGTIMKSASFSNSYVENLRIVIDPSATDSGDGKVTIRIKPAYKAGYTAPE